MGKLIFECCVEEFPNDIPDIIDITSNINIPNHFVNFINMTPPELEDPRYIVDCLSITCGYSFGKKLENLHISTSINQNLSGIREESSLFLDSNITVMKTVRFIPFLTSLIIGSLTIRNDLLSYIKYNSAALGLQYFYNHLGASSMISKRLYELSKCVGLTPVMHSEVTLSRTSSNYILECFCIMFSNNINKIIEIFIE